MNNAFKFSKELLKLFQVILKKAEKWQVQQSSLSDFLKILGSQIDACRICFVNCQTISASIMPAKFQPFVKNY